MTIIKIAANAVHARLIDAPREAKLIVSDLLSYAVEGHEFMTKRAGWDGRSSFFSFKTNSFPAGFVPRVQSALKKKGYRVQIIRKPRPEPLGPELPTVDEFGHDDERYSYQMETVRKLLTFGSGIAQISTGGGKSRLARLAYARIKRKTLFLTTRGSLMYQFRDACIESFGHKEVGIVGDSEWDANKPLVCGMVQTLAKRLAVYTADELIEQHLTRQQDREEKELNALKARQAKKRVKPSERRKQIEELKQDQLARRTPDDELLAQIEKKLKKQRKQRRETIELLRSFEFVIAEEAHEAGGNSYFDVMNACVNAHYRLALTATPFMRSDAESNMRLMGCTGGIMIKVTEKQLIDLGILATPKFMILPTERPKNLFKTSSYDKAYRVGIVENEWRNKRIVAECVRMSRFGLTSMVLVQRVNHGNAIKSYLTKLGMKVAFIYGDNDQDERKRALKKLGTGEINVLIGTNILDVGVDVPSVGFIALAGGGKAEVANRQRIGRGLRAKKSGPNICFVLDFMDEHNTHLQKHAFQRRAIITQTPGFAENLLPSGEVWNPSEYGFERI
ncbi:TPA: DEAD/DEAH box helicase family protein [Vibrio parahaemolyticus]|nr:DEAD/DEAH box helicase family protein [Vibrio parahaemolyticus]